MWTVKITPKAEKDFSKIDRHEQKRIRKYIETRLEREIRNPRSIGKPLSGTLRGLHRYRVGSYRLICRIEDAEVVILVIRIAYRKDAYTLH